VQEQQAQKDQATMAMPGTLLVFTWSSMMTWNSQGQGAMMRQRRMAMVTPWEKRRLLAPQVSQDGGFSELGKFAHGFSGAG
jgi:hypothetical protein